MTSSETGYKLYVPDNIYDLFKKVDSIMAKYENLIDEPIEKLV